MCTITYANMHEDKYTYIVGYVKSTSRNSVPLHNSKKVGCNNLYIEGP